MPAVASREFALSIVQSLRDAGFQALWAGGCVRDALLGKSPKDYDVATNATPAEIREIFGRSRTLPIGAAFGVITVLGGKSVSPIEVATFRRDAEYSDGRHPDSVSFSSAEEDARRRDFTINGLFYDPVDEQVIDYVGGQADMQRGVIRAIGDPHERIKEDKLRMLRGVRFAASLQFKLDERTRDAIVQHAPELSVVSAERITAELRRMLVDSERCAAMELLQQTKLLSVILPSWKPTEADWFNTLQILANVEQPTFTVAWACLTRALVVQQGNETLIQSICQHLKLSNDETNGTLLLLKHLDLIRAARESPWPSVQRVLILPRVSELMNFATAVAKVEDKNRSSIDFCERKLALPPAELNPPPLLTGDDLISDGVRPGPQFREILTQVRDEQLEGRLATTEEALGLARSMVD